MTVIKWAVVYGTIQADQFDTFEEAVESAVYASDAGSEAFQYVETIEEDGISRLYGWDSPEVAAIQDRIHDAQDASFKASAAIPRWVLSIRHPTEDRWGILDVHTDQVSAHSQLEELGLIVGADRLKVTAPR